MKKLKDILDPTYTKIGTYAGLTVIITAVLLMLLYLTGGFWMTLLGLFLAVLRPMILGGVFSYLLSPLVRKIEGAIDGKMKRSWSRPVAVALSYLLVVLVILLLLALIIFTMYHSFSAISLEGVKKLFASVEGDLTKFYKLIENKLAGLKIPLGKVGGIFTGFLNGVKNTFTGILFGVIFSIYFLLDGKRIGEYWGRAFRLMTGDKTVKSAQRFLEDADQAFSGYIRGQFVDAMIVGALSSVALLVAGVPSAIVIGILTGLGNLIPYIGPVVGYVIVLIVCIPLRAWTKMLIGLVILFIIMQVDGNIINPKLLSNNIKIHPLLVLAALIGGGAIGGFAGMIVAAPTAALLKIQFDRYLDSREKNVEQRGETDEIDNRR